MVKATRQASSHKEIAVDERFEDSLGDAIANKKYQSIKEVVKRFNLDKTDVKQLFGISESTQFRYEKQNPILKDAVADRLQRFNRITQQALELFEDKVETKRWLSTPKAALSGKTPLMALATDARSKKVEAMLYRAEYGMFG